MTRLVTVQLPAVLAMSVGYTLRQLARTNPQCGESLEAVGAALVKAAAPKLRVRGERGCI